MFQVLCLIFSLEDSDLGLEPCFQFLTMYLFCGLGLGVEV